MRLPSQLGQHHLERASANYSFLLLLLRLRREANYNSALGNNQKFCHNWCPTWPLPVMADYGCWCLIVVVGANACIKKRNSLGLGPRPAGAYEQTDFLPLLLPVQVLPVRAVVARHHPAPGAAAIAKKEEEEEIRISLHCCSAGDAPLRPRTMRTCLALASTLPSSLKMTAMGIEPVRQRSPPMYGEVSSRRKK